MYCSSCGANVPPNATFCQACGAAQPAVRVQRKNAGLAAVLSFFITGLGQIYNGQIAKGILLMIAQAILISVWWLIIPGIFSAVLWVWAIIDAYRTAERINAGAA